MFIVKAKVNRASLTITIRWHHTYATTHNARINTPFIHSLRHRFPRFSLVYRDLCLGCPWHMTDRLLTGKQKKSDKFHWRMSETQLIRSRKMQEKKSGWISFMSNYDKGVISHYPRAYDVNNYSFLLATVINVNYLNHNCVPHFYILF